MSLLDIAPPELTGIRFSIRGGNVDVRGIKNKEWVMLMKRYPEIKKLIGGGGMDVEEFYTSAADGIIPAVVAAGMGNCGDVETEELIKDRLSEAEQFAVFEAIMELGAADKEEARKSLSPLQKSPETGKLPNGLAGETAKMSSQQPSLL